MKRKFKFLFLVLVLSLVNSVTNAAVFSDETLHYVISYKWGLIHKDAGEATLSLKNKDAKIFLTLTGKTKKWADSFYSVRDTLKCTVSNNNFKPLSYTKITHEAGKYGRDEIYYSYNGNDVTGKCIRFKEKKGSISKSTKSLTASGSVYDMLSVFYYMRIIDYAKLNSGKSIKTTVFSGSESETLTIRSLGIENIKTRNNQMREAYHIKFKFTTDGNKKSSDDIDCWISTDSKHIPLLLIGKLPIGQIKCYYVG